MTEQTPTEQEVLDAAAAIVDAFAATDGERYFAGFAPDASFIFHTEAQRLGTREAYEALWQEWVASGWHVTSCASSEPLVTPMPGGAVFSHTVRTSVVTPDGPESYEERETIVFRSSPAGLLAIHEHLSPKP
jgi:ketosteroid isomerase-like protein